MIVDFEPSGEFAICVRIPGWARNQPVPGDLYRYMDKNDAKISLKVDGKDVAVDMEEGFARIERMWHKGDSIELNLPMPVRQVLCHEEVAANVGRVALERGPIVYCAEWPDNNGHVLNYVLADNTEMTSEYRKDLLNGVTVIRGKAIALSYGEDAESVLRKEQDFAAIPYYAWAHRGPGEMAVWLARTVATAQPLTPPGMIRNASFE
jgi:DUF1680 family protein